MKRFLDVVMAACGIVLMGPLFLLTIVLIRVSDGPPVFFLQTRIGKNGRPFKIIKFRTMVVDADKVGGWSTSDADPRITPVGRLIRRTSIDELPQLFNVLMGNMSIVGPRPDVPAQQGQYTASEWELRHRVRPGITGLAQASLRSAATVTERKALDLYYVNHVSIRGDLKIMLMTIRQLLLGRAN